MLQQYFDCNEIYVLKKCIQIHTFEEAQESVRVHP